MEVYGARSNYERYSEEDSRYYLTLDSKHRDLTCLLTRDG